MHNSKPERSALPVKEKLHVLIIPLKIETQSNEKHCHAMGRRLAHGGSV